MAEQTKELVELERASVPSAQQLASALFEIDRKYQEQFSIFFNELHAINTQIEQLEKEKALLSESIKKEEKELKNLSAQIDAELLHLEKLNEKIINKITVALEMKKVNNYNDAYKSMIDELSEDIRVLEIDILQKELQKENLQLKLMPSWQKITEIKDKLHKLQANKKYIESLGLNKSPIAQKNAIASKVIDTEIE